MPDEAHVRAIVESAFGPEAGPLLSLLRPSLRLIGDVGDAGDQHVRFGGPGVLGVDEPWPVWDARPLTFLAVIDCTAVHAELPESGLPASGTVTVWVHRGDEFGGPEHLLGGATSRHPAASRLVHHLAGADLRVAEPPDVVRDAAAFTRLPRLVRDVMWPIDLYALDGDPRFGLTEEHVEFAEHLLEQHAADDPGGWDRSRIGGWPTLHNAAEAVALVDAGLVDDRGDPAFRADGVAAVVADAPTRWHPLVQLEADPEVGWNWFGDGVLMFLGRVGDPVDDAIAYCSRQ